MSVGRKRVSTAHGRLRGRGSRTLAGLAAVLVVLSTAACGGGDSGDASAAADTPTAVTAPTAPATVALPPANGTFDYQLGGAYEPDPGVAIVDRDRTASPVPGRYNVCYVNAFQSQPEEKAFWFDHHPDLLLHEDGAPVTDPGWPGEYLFDLTTDAKRQALAVIVGGWIDGCAKDGFQAVEPDNLDAYTRSRGGYGADQALAFAALLTTAAHRAGLAIGQKNGGDLGDRGRAAGFDFAVVEECQVYRECGDYTDVYGDQVYEIEYTDNGRDAFTAACADHGARLSVVLRDRQVVPRGDPAYVDRTC